MKMPCGWIVVVTTLVLTACHAEPSSPSDQVTAKGSAADAQPDPNKDTVDVDDRYRMLLRDFQRLRAIWKQQPGNQKALMQAVSDVEQHIVVLRARFEEGPAVEARSEDDNQASENRAEENQVGKAPPAKGPVRPSDKPPTKEEMQRFLAALKRTHRGGPPLDERSTESKTLQGVQAGWVVKACAMAAAELKDLGGLFQQQPVDGTQVAASLDRLELILMNMDAPAKE